MAGKQDPLKFLKAEDFFAKFQRPKGPKSLTSVQHSPSFDPKDPLRYAALLSFDDQTTCLFQFVTPLLWRIRFDPKAKSAADYKDANTRTIVQDSFAALVDLLQDELRAKSNRAWNAPQGSPDSCWATTFEELNDQSGWVLSSVQYPSSKAARAGTDGVVQVKALFRKDPFQIQCLRTVQAQRDVTTPATSPETLGAEKIIWQTMPGKTFLQCPEEPLQANLVLQVAKPGSAQYLGFGEQGGRSLVKKPTFMNFFCYDNLGYSKVYSQGPLDEREPLYHSQPFYMEVGGIPGYRSATATLLDNYSQVFMDVGKTMGGRVKSGVRFGLLDTWILAADRIPQLIWLYTAIIGRPQLKPRYILGHHQGGYGYIKRQQLEDVVSSYHGHGIPLDGLHIDVDFQHRYRTFTTDDTNFPDVKGMFKKFRDQGVKCCTNITPIISLEGYRTSTDPYPTLNAAWDRDDHTNPAKNFLIMDKRYEVGLSDAEKRTDTLRYVHWDGVEKEIYANDPNARQTFINGKDDYSIQQNYNSGYPFHGGVSYGTGLGISGFYPDLNRKVVREEFWAKQYEDIFEKGLEFVWQDMTTPAVGDCYGDMLGFPNRLMMSEDPYEQTPDKVPAQKTALELWALYSYNLHKATYHALQKLPTRKNKRNFIIGRGSSTGMHRYAGLWTGDNRSTWQFWQITVAQVLSCGLGGISITGVDMGGFFPVAGEPTQQWCDPNLFIRWYSGSFLLPWYRNHYMGKVGQTAKLFQEVYKFSTIEQDYGIKVPENQRDLYASVEPICRYYVRLRYSLMQCLYDRMFENMINGLPIARSMLITDPDDTALYTRAAAFLDNQYLLGHYILVAPLFAPDDENNASRDIYLPSPNKWYPFNLRIDRGPENYGDSLHQHVEGGTIINYEARIKKNENEYPYLTPIYIRDGAIIPQIPVHLTIGDGQLTPITVHVYPGQNNWYSMYLDDGVSRDSAPGWLKQYSEANKETGDSEAHGVYREVRFDQQSANGTRTLKITNQWDRYDPVREVGDTFTIVLWTDMNENETKGPDPVVTFLNDAGGVVDGCTYKYRGDIGAAICTVPVHLAPGTIGGPEVRKKASLTIKHAVGRSISSVNGVNGVNGTNGINGSASGH